MNPGIKSDPKLLCKHVFFDLRIPQEPKEGDMVWMYCQYCLLTLPVKFVNESNKFYGN